MDAGAQLISLAWPCEPEGWSNKGEIMTLSGVERALGVIRIYLVERATQNDAVDDRSEELAQTIAACLREAKEPHQETPQDDPKTQNCHETNCDAPSGSSTTTWTRS